MMIKCVNVKDLIYVELFLCVIILFSFSYKGFMKKLIFFAF